jgi:hypothetical protein
MNVNKILVPIDSSHHSTLALQWGISLAQKYGAQLLLWTWPHVLCADVARCGLLPPLPRRLSSRTSYVISIWSPSHLPLPLLVVAKNNALGSTKPPTGRAVS